MFVVCEPVTAYMLLRMAIRNSTQMKSFRTITHGKVNNLQAVLKDELVSDAIRNLYDVLQKDYSHLDRNHLGAVEVIRKWFRNRFIHSDDVEQLDHIMRDTVSYYEFKQTCPWIINPYMDDHDDQRYEQILDEFVSTGDINVAFLKV